MQKLNLNERFTLCINIKKVDSSKVITMFTQSGFTITAWQQLPMNGFIELQVNVNLRKAEIIRQLLKNINVYD